MVVCQPTIVGQMETYHMTMMPDMMYDEIVHHMNKFEYGIYYYDRYGKFDSSFSIPPCGDNRTPGEEMFVK